MYAPLLCNALILKVPFEVDQSPLQCNSSEVWYIACDLHRVPPARGPSVGFPNECGGSIRPAPKESYLTGK